MIGMSRSNLELVSAVLTVASLCACGGGDTEPTAPALSGADAVRARAIYADGGCEICHGEQTEGVEDAGPALGSLAPYWTEERLVDYLADPDAFREANPDFENRRQQTFELDMPAYGEFAEDDLRLLARWLLTR